MFCLVAVFFAWSPFLDLGHSLRMATFVLNGVFLHKRRGQHVMTPYDDDESGGWTNEVIEHSSLTCGFKACILSVV